MATLSIEFARDKYSDINIHNVPPTEIPDCFIRPEGYEGHSLTVGTIRITLFPAEEGEL